MAIKYIVSVNGSETTWPSLGAAREHAETETNVTPGMSYAAVVSEHGMPLEWEVRDWDSDRPVASICMKEES